MSYNAVDKWSSTVKNIQLKLRESRGQPRAEPPDKTFDDKTKRQRRHYLWSEMKGKIGKGEISFTVIPDSMSNIHADGNGLCLDSTSVPLHWL